MKMRKSSGDRKAEILKVMLDLAFQVGPDHVTTGMISSRIGLTQPALYKHFPSKGDIWRAISDRLCARIAENSRIDDQAGHCPLGRLRHLILKHLDLVAETPALPEIMIARDPTSALADAQHRIQTAMNGFRRAMGAELESARKAGQLREAVRTEDGLSLLFGVIQSLLLRLIVTRDPTPLLQDGKRLIDLQLSLYAREGIAR